MPTPSRKCDTCGKRFEPRVKWQRFCSGACNTSERIKLKRTSFDEISCAGPDCSERFVPKTSKHRFHNDRCAQEARRHSQALLAPAGAYTPARRASGPSHPQGWEPGVAWDGTSGTITSKPSTDKKPKWDELLSDWGFDPQEFAVVEPVQVRTWEAAIGNGQTKQMWYYRASIVSRTKARQVDIEDVLRQIKSHKPRKAKTPSGDDAFVVVLSDWQAGKRDGDGLDGLVKRALQTIDGVKHRVSELRRVGHPLGSLYVLGLGDLLEGCGEFYAMQTFSVELDRREQTKVVRRLLTKALTTWAPLFERVVVAGVAGNHGENRAAGKSFTTFGDNDDVAVIEQVAEAFAMAPAYKHVSFVVPDEQLTMTLDVAGHILGLAHGHQADKTPGGTPQAKVWRWWEQQAMGNQPVGDADILITAHFHHFAAREDSGRLHLQAPTLDGGSEWFKNKTGRYSVPGTMTLRLAPGEWGDLKILGREA